MQRTTLEQPLMLIATLGGALLLAAGCGCSEDKKSVAADAGDAGVCAPGTSGCACRDGVECNDGLECIDGLCSGTTAAGLVIDDPDARGCELLLEEGASRPVGATYADSVRGTFVREAPRFVLSFVSKTDAPIEAGSVQVLLAGENADLGGVAIAQVECVDKEGAVLSEVKASFSE